MTFSVRALARTLCFGVSCCALASAPAPSGSHDAAFDTIPFNDWVGGSDSATRVRWSARVMPAQLSFRQRLITTVTVEVDGAELARRRGKGEFVVFTQFTDEAGKSYQSHSAVDLTRVEEGISGSMVSYPVRAFVLPGEYRVSILLLDSASKDHWSKIEKVRVGSLRNDPLSDAWNDLPAVEFMPTADPPESFLLPADHLNLPTKSNSPARIDVLVNLTPSERLSGSTRYQNQTLAALIPTLKAISEMRFTDAKLNVELLDLSRKRIAFHRDNAHDLDWESLRDALKEDSTNTIDVKSLESRGKNAAFFVKQVSRKLFAELPPGTKHLVIVLSGATAFESGEDLRPIEAAPGHGPLFYIRYAPPVVHPQTSRYEGRRMRGFGGPPGIGQPGRGIGPDHIEGLDQLLKTVKPVSPRLFDVESPEQMRKALAAIRDEIGSL